MESERVTPGPLMEMATGFWVTRTLAAAVGLDLFTRFGVEGCTAAELVDGLGIAERPAEMLLTACASLGLLDVRDGRFVNSAMAEEFLVRGRPYYLGGWVDMVYRRLYGGSGELERAIRTNRPTSWDPDRGETLFDGFDPQMMETFWAAMHSLSSFSARVLGQAVDLGGVRRLLDVGGGSGAYDIELCRRYPELTATVFDLPQGCEAAARKVGESGFARRIDIVSGDFLGDDPLPGGHDAALLSMILHDWNEEHCLDILRKVHEALPPGGLLLVCELFVDDDKSGPAPAALMSLNMLVEGEGRNYTAAECADWLTEVGFAPEPVVRFESPGANGVLVARRR
ncbi:methyltransferase [Actinomadura harenae]|uniref:Methyltransferase domain-containing protein n=1 Tax=Actinomadura harenae TaxID=2483351 RepID=A0A3M2LQ34_9ACTN|nr:methyltransferase [Actinomadura harenae]RMI36958.1 methyltransferase domain-containing protein [Actinomadura harenae]